MSLPLQVFEQSDKKTRFELLACEKDTKNSKRVLLARLDLHGRKAEPPVFPAAVAGLSPIQFSNFIVTNQNTTL